MDWQTLITSLLGGGGGAALIVYLLKRWLVHQMSNDAARGSALIIKDDIIKQLRLEMRDRDADWQLRWDRREKDGMEYRQRVDRELRVFRSVSQATVKDIRTLAAAGPNTIPEDRLETTIHITGMGPLDV